MTSLTIIDPKAPINSAPKIGRSAASEEYESDQGMTPHPRSLAQQINRQKPIMKIKSVSHGSSKKRISFEDRTYAILIFYSNEPGSSVKGAWKRLRLGAEKTFYYHVRRQCMLGLLQKSGYGFEITRQGRKWLIHYIKRIPTLGLDLRCHELLMVCAMPPRVLVGQRYLQWDEGDVHFNLTIGSKRRKLTLQILQNKPGLDYNGLSLSLSIARKRIGDILNWVPRTEELSVENFQFNVDHKYLRMEGVNSISVKSLLGTVSRVYNKDEVLRVELQGGGLAIPLPVALDFLADPESWIQGIRTAELQADNKAILKAVERIQGELIMMKVKQESGSEAPADTG